MADAVASTLDYLGSRDLLSRLPDSWSALMAELLVPLRHYESGAQMISCDVTRFGFGTTITQCAGFAAFDRIGNAQAHQPARHRPRRWHRRAARRGEDPLGRRRLAAGPAPLRRGAVPGEGLGQGAHPARRARPPRLRPVLHPPRRRGHRRRRRVVQPVRAAPGHLVQGPAQVGRRPLQGVGRRPARPAPRTRRCSPRPPPRRSTRSRGHRAARGSRRRARRCRRARHVETTATTVRDAVAALTA